VNGAQGVLPPGGGESKDLHLHFGTYSTNIGDTTLEPSLLSRKTTKAIRLDGWPCFWAAFGIRPCLFVRRDGACLVIVDVEYRVKLGQLQQVMHLLGELQKLQRRTLVL